VENRFELTVPPHDSAGACLSEVSRPDNDIPHLPQTEGPRSDPLMQRRPHLLYGTATPAIDHVGLPRAPFPVGNIRAASLSSPSRTCTGHTASHAAPNHGSIASIRGTTPSSSYRGWKVASHPVRHLPHPAPQCWRVAPGGDGGHGARPLVDTEGPGLYTLMWPGVSTMFRRRRPCGLTTVKCRWIMDAVAGAKRHGIPGPVPQAPDLPARHLRVPRTVFPLVVPSCGWYHLGSK